MDQSYSESDVSLSPTQILERLHMLRQFQLMQQGKLQKQRLQYEESSRSSTITEIVSQFSNSTGFNTFRSLLESPRETSTDSTPRVQAGSKSKSPQVKPQDLIDGVSVLNLSQESEFIVNSPVSSRSKVSTTSTAPRINELALTKKHAVPSLAHKKQISLDDMPILSPKKDFEALIIEKLKNELDAPKGKILQKENKVPEKGKKPFLKRGEGMTRFGIKKNDLVIQSTHDLPWKHKSSNKLVVEAKPNKSNKEGNVDVQILVTAPKAASNKENEISPKANKAPNNASQKSPVSKVAPKNKLQENDTKQTTTSSVDSSNCEIHAPKPVFMVPQITKDTRLQVPKGKHPLLNNKGKTWAAVFTKEQDDFLRQLKQSDYYKNFTSPAKSLASDISCDENLLRLRQDREIAEQNMFELLENKVDHESFNVDNSFVYRFLKGTNLESSGESTPLILQKCLANNPGLKMIFPETQRMRNETLQSDPETCNSECTECCNETCTSVSDCCSCNTVEETTNSERGTSKSTKKTNFQQVKIGNKKKEVGKVTENEPDNDKTEDDTDIMKANLAEMNAKLIATSEVLKDRLVELEDEIETFRKENVNLTKMREEIETEKHKFFEEKSAFEQKFNEEKILSEYYLAEEKEKLSKQKQIYDRQVREMRGRLNKKEKDEVINLKKEINDLKEEIRLKDAKSTTTVARLRNQLKIMEKEKKELQDEIEKLKKENRRIQHSNDISQRLTNMKYLEEVNKKLKNFNTKSAKSQVELDEKMKYKGVEMERQSRSKRIPPTAGKNPLRARAKSVPNLNVTSRYAKYFSQRDVLSPTERNQTINIDTCPSEDGDNHSAYEIESSNDTESIQDATDNENENSLEKIYMERFQDTSKENSQSEVIDRSSLRGSRPNIERSSNNEYSDGFFIRRSNSNSSSITNSKSPKQLSPHYQPSGSSSNRSKSPVSILSNKSSSSRRSPVSVIREHAKPDYLSTHARSNDSQSRSRSPVSILSNQTYSSRRQPTVITKSQLDNRLSVSPEPSSKTSLAKTDLKPMEIRKPDGSRELRFPNGNVKHLSADGKYSKFIYYNGDVKENFFNEGRIKYYYAETKTVHTTHPDGLEVLEFPDGQVEKRYPDNSSEIRLPNGSVRYYDPKNEHVREEWRFPDGATLTVAADGSRRVQFANGQVEVHTEDHKRREFPDGTVKLVYNDGTSETRYASGRVRIKDKHGNLIMDSVPG